MGSVEWGPRGQLLAENERLKVVVVVGLQWRVLLRNLNVPKVSRVALVHQ